MKILKNLIRVDALLLALFAWLEAFGTRSRASEEHLALSLLGTGLLVCAVLLLLVGNLLLVGGQRRLGRYLAAGNVIFSFMVMVYSSGKYSTDVTLVLVLVPVLIAGALVWASLLPLKPEEAAAELSDLRVPDEVRQALLRQVGESAAQEERNRLARDLHDSVKQQLFTINVGAATAQERWERDPEGARAALVDVRRSAREAMAEMQAMLHQLRPQALTSTTGLVEALREQAEALGYRSGAQVTVELGPEIPDDRMPPGALEALFRIAQEALANVARHARAGTVRIWIGVDGEEAVLRVEDDGQGFDPQAAVSGMGLRNLRERAAALRGRVEIESVPGAGSTVTARIPLLPPVAPASKSFEKQLRFHQRYLWIPWTLTVISVLLVGANDHSLNHVGLFFLLPVLFALQNRFSPLIDPRRSPEAGFLDVARFRFFSHRSILFRVFAAAVAACSFWAQARVHSQDGQLVWLALTGVCLGWALFELAVFHRLGERRREWRTLVQPDRWGFDTALWALAMILWGWCLRSVSSSIQMTLYVVMMAFLLYILSRQPRLGETRP